MICRSDGAVTVLKGGWVAFGVPVQAADGSTVTYDTAEEAGKATMRQWTNDASPRIDVL